MEMLRRRRDDKNLDATMKEENKALDEWIGLKVVK